MSRTFHRLCFFVCWSSKTVARHQHPNNPTCEREGRLKNGVASLAYARVFLFPPFARARSTGTSQHDKQPVDLRPLARDCSCARPDVRRRDPGLDPGQGEGAPPLTISARALSPRIHTKEQAPRVIASRSRSKNGVASLRLWRSNPARAKRAKKARHPRQSQTGLLFRKSSSQ